MRRKWWTLISSSLGDKVIWTWHCLWICDYASIHMCIKHWKHHMIWQRVAIGNIYDNDHDAHAYIHASAVHYRSLKLPANITARLRYILYSFTQIYRCCMCRQQQLQLPCHSVRGVRETSALSPLPIHLQQSISFTYREASTLHHHFNSFQLVSSFNV